jgi:hypothetical protein
MNAVRVCITSEGFIPTKLFLLGKEKVWLLSISKMIQLYCVLLAHTMRC